MVSLRWEITKAVWTFGTPEVGPTNAFAGKRCAATGLRHDEASVGSSSLVSPPIWLPAASEEPRLRFWHWFKIHPSHYGEITVRTEGGVEEAIPLKYSTVGIGWTPASVSLTKWGGQRVQIGFHFANYVDPVWPGWFIDEVEVVAGGQLFGGFDDFEGGWGDWSAERGNWYVGSPAIGPMAAWSGTNCAAVALNGDGFPISPFSSSLVSPPMQLPSVTEGPRLRFWQWFRIHPSHYGQVWIRLADGSEEPLSVQYSGSAPGWSPVSLSLAKYQGQKVQFKFLFTAYVDSDWPGWFIDDVQIETLPPLDLQAGDESFEGGWGDWSVDRGNWSVGKPTIGPGGAITGTNCAAVSLNGEGFPVTPMSSSLLSPRFRLPEATANPRLNFQHWFRIHPSHSGQVWIRLEDGVEEALSIVYNGDSGGWTTALLSLSKYGGKTVQFRFYFAAYVDDDWPGWFIDDVRILPRLGNSRPAFDPVAPQIAHALEPLEFVVKATDPDSGQTLTYSMDTNTAPATARFDAPTRTFSWTPTVDEADAPGYYVTFRVVDDGTPPLRSFLVVPLLATVKAIGDPTLLPVQVAPSIVLSDLQDYSGWTLRLVGGMRGFNYVLQSSSNPREPWNDVGNPFALRSRGQTPRLLAPVAVTEGQRFFRLRMEPLARDVEMKN